MSLELKIHGERYMLEPLHIDISENQISFHLENCVT